MKKYLFSLLLLSLLSACGQIGPLYMPDNPNPPVHTPKPEKIESEKH